MGVYEIDPPCDPRWPEFLQNNPRASVFHTPGWLRALKRTYGYEPIVYTTTPATWWSSRMAGCSAVYSVG